MAQWKEEEMTINWRDLFREYSNLVGEYEGTSFLYEHDWTPEEWKEELWKEA